MTYRNEHPVSKSCRRFLTALSLLSILALLSSCDLRSDTAKRDMEKFAATPFPSIAPIPTPTPIDPADIIQVDTGLEGETIPVTGHEKAETVTCRKYDRVMVNGDAGRITVKGACRQIMVNGDGNQITADAAAEIVLNGSDNIVRYLRYANGRQPLITENQEGNTIEKVSSDPVTSGGSKRKIAK